MFPSNNATPELLAIQAELEARGEDWLSDCPPLLRVEVYRIGASVLFASSIEFNLRRAVEIFARTGRLARKFMRDNDRLSPAVLVKAVVEPAAALAKNGEERAVIEKRFDSIEYCRTVRHLLAHAPARRVPGHDTIVFLTKSERDAERIMGAAAGRDHSLFALIPAQGLRDLMQMLRAHDVWLAHQIPRWHAELIGNAASS